MPKYLVQVNVSGSDAPIKSYALEAENEDAAEQHAFDLVAEENSELTQDKKVSVQISDYTGDIEKPKKTKKGTK